MKKYKKVIVLGAGFSKALCSSMPVIKELFENTEENSMLNSFVKRAKEKLNDYFDVENCVSYILSREIFFTDKEDIEFYTLRKEILKHIYNEMKSCEPDADKLDTMGKFLCYCDEENILLVTFNYDLFIEKICKRINGCGNFAVKYGIKLNQDPYQEGTKIDGGDLGDKNIELLKLHGSFNWFSMSKSDNADIDDIISVEQDGINEIFIDDVPFYVPMSNTKYKYFAGNFYKLLWKKMKYYLDNAEVVDFIGYGFPKTDFDNLMLFSSYKEKVKNIVIYKSLEDKQTKKRLEKIFSSAQVHTDGTINYIERIIK
ncbi:SIR2 family protein [Clostridium psychrophilum]|uniref:SIR2 family protein n=1 Tax=Clostridium psychrophilum TaxID=132926 RepID=UPI001C0A9990|nr:SIR2 family protein [Clostridium psychrophilum]MBU3182038.1 SIR2 family protein [Clostridium psychrophilum]